ncbi:MAG TPA: calcium/proton exchanger [Candidatus Polarisedimenticolia bacterium]|nr:calcium/proton exchanger [Candidatus Polarisedimenticolia bacterium]
MLWLLLFAPLALILEHAGAPAPAIFFCAAIAIVPIASLIVAGTESIAHVTGPAIGGLLNATFGNLPELIIALVALRSGLVEMVRASLVGALLANLLLGLGLSFLLGGLRFHVQDYNPTAARAYASMMLLAVISMAIPSAFHRFFGAEAGFEHSSVLDASVALVLLLTYGLYLVYQLRTHKEAFAEESHAVAAGGAGTDEAHGPRWSPARAGGTLVAASVAAAWLSEILVGAAEETGHSLGMSPTFIGLILLASVGGAAEIGSAIAMGRKNKMDLSVGIALGSCIQIALFVAPLLVLVGGLVGPVPFALTFNRGEMGFLFISVLLGGLVASDGRSTWFKGVQLLAVYVMLAAVCYLVPAAAAAH